MQKNEMRFLSYSTYRTSVCLCVSMCVCVFGRVQFFVAPWTVAQQVPLPVEFSTQGYWSRLPFPTPGALPDLGIEPTSLVSPVLAGRFFTT